MKIEILDLKGNLSSVTESTFVPIGNIVDNVMLDTHGKTWRMQLPAEEIDQITERCVKEYIAQFRGDKEITTLNCNTFYLIRNTAL